MKITKSAMRVVQVSLGVIVSGSLFCGCGRNSGGFSETDAGATQTSSSGQTITGLSANNPRVNPAACQSFVSDSHDSQALSDIAKLSKKQCQDNYQQLVNFYVATKDMTDDERKAYFQNTTSAINPPPPPPPAPCSVITQALLKCAQQ